MTFVQNFSLYKIRLKKKWKISLYNWAPSQTCLRHKKFSCHLADRLAKFQPSYNMWQQCNHLSSSIKSHSKYERMHPPSFFVLSLPFCYSFPFFRPHIEKLREIKRLERTRKRPKKRRPRERESRSGQEGVEETN
jgi:hypothetical protein